MRKTTRLVVGFATAVLVWGVGATEPAQALTDTQIKRAQRALNSLDCNAGQADGVVGPRTRSAVHRFQSANRLPQGGKLTAKTRNRLYSSKAKRCVGRAVPKRSGVGRRIVLSQRQNWLWLVGPRGGIIAQGGLIDNARELSRGRYFTGSKCGRAGRIRNNSDYSGNLRLHNFVRFAPCGIGFHQIPKYWSNGKQIHRDFYLGTNMKRSAGCVRVSRATSYKIWKFTRQRTKVKVVWA
ncbi:MAG: L,D-transpeptidase family protein [Propionibacteriales bacterium]|nr:L,D-transpeptidase family protein [Propionibacteriales bacterium]